MPTSLKTLLFWLALALIFPIGVWLFVQVVDAQTPPGPTPPLGPTLGDPQPTVFTDPTLAADWPVTFVDASARWDWTNTCLDELTAFAVSHSIPLLPTEFRLMDPSNDAPLPLGVAFPSVDDPEALALTRCDQTDDTLTCRVTLAAGVPGLAADAALAVALGLGLHDWARPKDAASWQARADWDWMQFVPLIDTDEEGRWRTSCLTLDG